uniref:Putative GTP diphosphokinase RSH1, chloroplastic n=1 Tax=Amphora coffeiformis TaxID=265554 RepID=A0A7S3L4X9_9STRA|eukprot:scaffold5787_cov157-Amphora_coffeaeformis.AAC.14
MILPKRRRCYYAWRVLFLVLWWTTAAAGGFLLGATTSSTVGAFQNHNYHNNKNGRGNRPLPRRREQVAGFGSSCQLQSVQPHKQSSSSSTTTADWEVTIPHHSDEKKYSKVDDDTFRQSDDDAQQPWNRLTSLFTKPRDREMLDKAREILLLQQQHQDQQGVVDLDHIWGRASILADMKLRDVATLVTSLVYDQVAVNDKPQSSTTTQTGKDDDRSHKMSLQDVQNMFGTEVRNLVRGVHQIGGIIQYDHYGSSDKQAEYYRCLMIATAKDIRVILVKLADQTLRIRTMDKATLDPEERKDIALETLGVYAPLAHRWGFYSIKTEMEDTALRYWKPATFRKLQTLVAARQEQRQIYTDKVIEALQGRMESTGLASAKITGRAKSFYSIFQKMQSQNLNFHDIQDLMAFRILVDDVAQCYQALGIVQAHWDPVPGRFKDYIAQPKINGYQSLHTTVVGPDGRHIEVQIRTHQMHEVAEGGVAAHWIYKGKHAKNAQEAERFAELRRLVEGIQTMNDEPDRESSSTHDLTQPDLFENDVFVFSPDGELFAVSKGATVLDFAYRIHSKLGDHCVGAKVDGRMLPLRYQVKNGETVEIMQSSTQRPHQEWLKLVKTSKAKQRIKSWLRKQRLGQEGVSVGRELLEKELRRYTSKRQLPTDGLPEYREKLDDLLVIFKLEDEDHLFRALAFGQIGVSSVIREVFRSPRQVNRGVQLNEDGQEVSIQVNSGKGTVAPQPVQSEGLVVGGKRNMMVIFCRNCRPLYGDEVEGVVTRGRGVKVHRRDCKYLVESEMERRVGTVWDEAAKSVARPTHVEVIFEDTPDMLANMSKALSLAKVRLGGVVMKRISDGRGLARFELMLSSIDDLAKITLQLQQERGVLSVTRK